MIKNKKDPYRTKKCDKSLVPRFSVYHPVIANVMTNGTTAEHGCELLPNINWINSSM